MRVAVPMLDDQFCAHFGRCNGVMLCEIDIEHRHLAQPRHLKRPGLGCEGMPDWLASLGVEHVLAGGLGAGAQQSLAGRNIGFTIGLSGRTGEEVVQQYLENPRAERANPCDDHHEHEHHHCRH